MKPFAQPCARAHGIKPLQCPYSNHNLWHHCTKRTAKNEYDGGACARGHVRLSGSMTSGSDACASVSTPSEVEVTPAAFTNSSSADCNVNETTEQQACT